MKLKLLSRLLRFYGGGDSPPSQTSTSTVTQQYSPEETAARAKLFSTGEAIYNKTKDQIASGGYPGAKPVGFSPESIQAQNMVTSAALGPGQQIANSAAGALNFGLGDVLYPGSNPALAGTIDTAVRRLGTAYTDPNGVLSKIRSNSMAGNSSDGSGTREGIAMGIAGRNYLNTVGDTVAGMSSDGYNKGLDFMKSSMAFAPNMYNLMMQPGVTIGAVGSQKEAQSAAEANYAAAARNWDLTADWQALGPYASLVTGLSNPSTVTSSTAPMAGGGSNKTAPLGSAMMGASAGSAFGPWGAVIGAGAGLLFGMSQQS